MGGGNIQSEQIRTLYRQTETVLLANCVNGAIVCALLWTSTPHAWIAGWLGATAVISAARFVLACRYRHAKPEGADARAWGTRYVIGSVLSGALWGGAGFLFLQDDSPLSQLLVVFFVGGMCSAAAGTLAAYLPAFLGFISPALAALALRVALFGDPLHDVLAGVIVFYGVGLYAVARVNHRSLAEAFALRYENAELVASLSRAQRGLEQNNRTLEQRVAERTEALRKQTEALRDAQRLEAVGRLAGGVAHDFNNLLTIILANISELVDRDGLDARTRAALREMHDAGSKGADLVRQLLAFSRRQRTTPETFDLNRTLAGMDRLLVRLLGEGVALKLELHPDTLLVHMDPTQLEQVIVNLVTNARDAMPEGGVVRVQTETAALLEETRGIASGVYAVLRVSDTGIGMDRSIRQHIFEPFFTTKDVGKGTGLGLSTAYGIVEQGGGHIDVSSEPRRGSSFAVYLPLSAATAERPSSSPRLVSGFRALLRPRAKPVVMLVEDEPTVRSVTRRILDRAGYRVLVSSSAERALEIFAGLSEPLDLLITDVVMAGMDGPRLAERLRDALPGLKTLFISGYSREHAVPRDVSHSIGFLAKPFTHDELLAKVSELLAEPEEARLAAGREE
ncbi:MAG TPA: ATP-binding protein [Polyangiaceae bacterium]|nr:ATP-binding protein [Polyangiaceae bacterium]